MQQWRQTMLHFDVISRPRTDGPAELPCARTSMTQPVVFGSNQASKVRPDRLINNKCERARPPRIDTNLLQETPHPARVILVTHLHGGSPGASLRSFTTRPGRHALVVMLAALALPLERFRGAPLSSVSPRLVSSGRPAASDVASPTSSQTYARSSFVVFVRSLEWLRDWHGKELSTKNVTVGIHLEMQIRSSGRFRFGNK